MFNLLRKVKRAVQNKIFDKNKFRPYLSFSQCGEDLIIDYIFKHYLRIDKPSYIDVGAHHPSRFSNTALFYSTGSRGINIEPNPKLFKNFLEKRKYDINLNVGVSDKNDIIDFYVMSVATMSTFCLEEATMLERDHGFKIVNKQKVKVYNIKDIIKENFDNIFPDFLSLDVEGLEEPILKSIDYKNNFPKVICLETVSYESNRLGKKDVDLINFLEGMGYMVYADTFINTIFVRKELLLR